MIARSFDEIGGSDIERDDEAPRGQMIAEAVQIRCSVVFENDHGSVRRHKRADQIMGYNEPDALFEKRRSPKGKRARLGRISLR
jgi:hypothetical protein